MAPLIFIYLQSNSHIMNNRGLVYSYVAIVLILITGCVDMEKFEEVAPVNVTTVSATTTVAIPVVTPAITYPNTQEVKKYVADLKKVPQDEVKIIDFQNIRDANMVVTRAYHSGGYVAVSVIIANYTSLVMAYKNHSDVINIGNYTASTDEEKKLFDLLTNISYESYGPFDGNLIPINITIIDSSYIINKNETYKLNFTLSSEFYSNSSWSPIENPYASFKFVTRFNGFHGYWPESYGWFDAKTKRIWILMIPQV